MESGHHSHDGGTNGRAIASNVPSEGIRSWTWHGKELSMGKVTKNNHTTSVIPPFSVRMRIFSSCTIIQMGWRKGHADITNCQISCTNIDKKIHFWQKTYAFCCRMPKTAVPLHRVFHSIRFKVNKIGVQRYPIFLCRYGSGGIRWGRDFMEVPEGAGRKRRFRKETEGPEGPEVPEGDGTTTGTTFWNVCKANHALIR